MEDVAYEIDSLKIVQLVLSKQLPKEQYNDIIHLMYVINVPNATTEEIEGALVKYNFILFCSPLES